MLVSTGHLATTTLLSKLDLDESYLGTQQASEFEAVRPDRVSESLVGPLENLRLSVSVSSVDRVRGR